MTAWRLGEDASRTEVSAAGDGAADPVSYVGRVLEWIPADVIALYAAAITAFEQEPTDGSSKVLIVGGVVLAFVAVVLGAFAGDGFSKTVWLRACLAPIAFLIWSPSVPNSGWQDIEWIADHPGLTVMACAVLAFIFALAAQGLEKRIKRKPKPEPRPAADVT